MFQGTVDQKDNSRRILVETHEMDGLNPDHLPQGCFGMILLKSGELLASIQEQDCYFEAPALICLDNSKQFRPLSDGNQHVKIINFDPQFLNVNMKIETVRSEDYQHLCQQHAFFQLSPFLTDDINKLGFQLSNDTMSKIDLCFERITQNITEQQDWYWSCRARSYFIDIINILERIFHDYYLEESEDACIKPGVSNEFKTLVAYINNHLEEKHTLDSLYAHFRINKNQIEELFREFLGTTFYDYLKKRRYEEASYYLRFTELDGTQIAQRIGFSSSQNFCKFFHAVSGYTPNKFRREMVGRRREDIALQAVRS